MSIRLNHEPKRIRNVLDLSMKHLATVDAVIRSPIESAILAEKIWGDVHRQNLPFSQAIIGRDAVCLYIDAGDHVSAMRFGKMYLNTLADTFPDLREEVNTLLTPEF